MSLLKKILSNRKKLREGDLNAYEPNSKSAQYQNAFALLKDIHGADIKSTDITNHLKKVDDSEEEVDTVAFGLETSDGQIVKVYVNADEADAFEDKMSQMLGKVDDIDKAIEELSDEFDIVSVIKPEDFEAEGGEATGNEDESADSNQNIENKLDEPLTDEDLVDQEDLEMEDDLDQEEDAKKDKSKSKKKDDDSESAGASEDEDKEDKDDSSIVDLDDNPDALDFGGKSEDDEREGKDDDKETEEDTEAEAEAEDEEDKSDEESPKDEEDNEEDDSEEDSSEEDKKKKKKKKEEKDSNVKESKMSIESKMLLEGGEHQQADLFSIHLTKEESGLEELFNSQLQVLIYRIILLLGVSSEQLAMRKFKLRKGIKAVAFDIQHHPQIKTNITFLGKELAAKKKEIYAINESLENVNEASSNNDANAKEQLPTEASRKIYDLIIALGVPEFLLTYKKTQLKQRLKNLSRIISKHTKIKTYIYYLIDQLNKVKKSGHSELKENLLSRIDAIVQKEKSILESIVKSDGAANLGIFSVTDLGDVGGITLKVKNFSIDFNEKEFEKFKKMISGKKGGVLSTENIGKITLIPHGSAHEFTIKRVKPVKNDEFPFGVVLSEKSIKKILKP